MSERVPDVVPTVSVSVAYGKYVESLDINMTGIVEYLQGKGMSDDEIENLHIYFSDENGIEEKFVTHARYSTSTDTIEMLSLDKIKEASKTAHRLFDRETTVDLNQLLVHELEHKIAKKDEDLQRRRGEFHKKFRKSVIVRSLGSLGTGLGAGIGAISMPAVNELLEKPEIYGLSPLQLVGMLAVAEVASRGFNKVWPIPTKDDAYFNNPEEVHVRQIADKSDEKFISVKPRYVDFLTTETIDYQIKLLEALRDGLKDNSNLSNDVASQQV